MPTELSFVSEKSLSDGGAITSMLSSKTPSLEPRFSVPLTFSASPMWALIRRLSSR